MKDLFPMHGIITTVITPFEAGSKKIDIASLRREYEAALAAGVGGFLVPCMASEMWLLSEEEKLLLTREAVEASAGKALVIPSISASTREERLRQCEQYLALGVSGLNVNMPFTGKEEYESIIAEVDAMKPPFLVIQDLDMSGYGLPDDVIRDAFEKFDSFRCIKIEVKDSGPKYTKVLEMTGGRLNVSGAWGSSQSIEAYDRGIHALMPSGMFELFVNVYRLYHEKDRKSAMQVFFDMLPIISFTRQNQPLNRYFHKLYMQRAGIFTEAVSREEVVFDQYHQRYANDLIDLALELRDSVPDYWK